MERADQDSEEKTTDREVSPNIMRQNEWERIILDYSMMGKPEQPLPTKVNFRGRAELAYKVLSELYELDLKMWPPDAKETEFNMGFTNARRRYLRELAREIKRSKKYSAVPLLFDAIIDSDLEDIGKMRLSNDLLNLYLLLCEPNKFLVGLKDGISWKRITWPETMKEYDLRRGADSLAYAYIFNLQNISQNEIDLVPENPLFAEKIDNLKFPRPAKRGEELLEEAFYNQRYIVPPEGAEVRFQKAGDAEKLILRQKGNTLFCKLYTSNGEVFIWIDLDRAEGSNFIGGEANRIKWLQDITCNLTAEVYRDLVTAIELPKNRFKTLRGTKGLETISGQMDEVDEKPKVIYIPRIIRTGRSPEIRDRYDGPTRPVTPHKVSGHLRRANMTERHRLELIRFEKKHNIPVLKHIPAGYTFVRPFVVPSGEELLLRDLPTFIKRRIETQLQSSIERQLNGKTEN